MPWFNADDRLHSHPKPRQAGLEAMGLWVLAGTHASCNKSDGFIPDWYIETWPKGHRLAQKLIDARLWDKADGGYQFRSWDEYQRTKEQVERDQERNRERQRKYREKREAEQRDEHR